MDWGGPVSHSKSSDEVVTVPDTPNPLSRGYMCELQRIMTPSHMGLICMKGCVRKSWFCTC